MSCCDDDNIQIMNCSTREKPRQCSQQKEEEKKVDWWTLRKDCIAPIHQTVLFCAMPNNIRQLSLLFLLVILVAVKFFVRKHALRHISRI